MPFQYNTKKTISCKASFHSEHTRWLHGQQLTGPRKRVRPPDFVAVLVGWLEDRHRTRMRGPHTYSYAYFSRAKFSYKLDREKCTDQYALRTDQYALRLDVHFPV